MSNHDWDDGFDDGIINGRKEREAEIIEMTKKYIKAVYGLEVEFKQIKQKGSDVK
jgi:hypothetical protein